MKLVSANQIELSESNVRALISAFEARQRGHEAPQPLLYRTTDDGTIAVSVVADEEHYTPDELAARPNWKGAANA